MEELKKKMKKLRPIIDKAKANHRTIVSISAIVIVCILVICVIALGSTLAVRNARINTIHAKIQSRALYTISSAKTLADSINKPGADVPGVILPELQCTLSTLGELNSLLSQLFGSDALIVDESLMTKIDASLYELTKCYSTGKPADTQLATLGGYLSEMVNVLNYYTE